jgi:thioredoxin 1
VAWAVHNPVWRRDADANMNSNQDKRLIVEVGQADFESEVLRAAQPVVVAFLAPWSRPCHILDATLEEVAAAFAASAKVVRVNADDHPDLSLWYEVQSIPTLLYFVEGSLRARMVGTASKEAILARLATVLAAGETRPAPLDPGREHQRRRR